MSLLLLTQIHLFLLYFLACSASCHFNVHELAKCSNVYILPSYRLTVGTDRGTNNDAGAVDEHGLSSQNGNNFVTYDRTGGLNEPECAIENFGWWITSCTATNLNDVWHTVENVNNLRWIKDNLWRYPTYTEMKIRAQ